MSQSFAHDGGMEQSGGESSDEQLAAEIADHLAAATGDLVRRGEAEEQAARLALARFGDVARVKRQCWWIHNGEEVMFRMAGIGLLSLLTIGVAVVGFGGWQLQRNLTSRTEELSEQLASLTTTQQAMLAQAPEKKTSPEESFALHLFLRLDKSGEPKLYLDMPASEDLLRLLINGQEKHPAVFLAATKGIPYAEVVKVIDMLGSLGMHKISLDTKHEKSAP